MESVILKLTEYLLSRLDKALNDSARSRADYHSPIERHLTMVLNWASTYTFLGLGTPKDCARDAISLTFSDLPRRFRSRGSETHRSRLSEEELLNNTHHLLILGDPGAGKTTTLRRLALRLLKEQPRVENDDCQYPLLVLLKDLPSSRFVAEHVASLFGLPCTRSRPASPDFPTHMMSTNEEGDYVLRIGEHPAADILPAILDDTSALVILDGLDEIDYRRRRYVQREIEQIAMRLKRARIVLSCRSGDISTVLHGFKVLEILPLDNNDVLALASSWLPQPAPFLDALANSPYADIIDRPLLLTFLLFLFGRDSYLPEQPSLVYRRVVYRLLQDWDEERGVTRQTKYARFDPDRKIDFLSELAYLLTYESKKREFSQGRFEFAFSQLAQSFDLPTTDCRSVASELETHTGIVLASGLEVFEFAHLSLQEYLCANYIHRCPEPELLHQYFCEYPAPIAVACALSSNPSQFLAGMLKRNLTARFADVNEELHGEGKADERQLTFDFFGASANAMKGFISRLLIERPAFKVDRQLGYAILCLFAFYYRRYRMDLDEKLVEVLSVAAVRGSVIAAIRDGRLVAYQVTERTVAVDLREWFLSLFRSLPGTDGISPVLFRETPFALVPFGAKCGGLEKADGVSIGVETKDIRRRLTITLSATPFCALENGRHRMMSLREAYEKDGTDVKRRCKVCGCGERTARTDRRWIPGRRTRPQD